MISVTRRFVILCGLVICGCTSAVSGTRAEFGNGFYPEEVAFIRADSELFEAVVTGQLAGTPKEPPYHLDSPRFDARPYGNDSAHRRYLNDFEREDSTFPSLIRPSVFTRIIDNRKAILARLGVTEGGPAPAPSCPGILVVPHRSPDDSTYRKELERLRAGCPKKADYYVTVGLPIRTLTAAVIRRMQQVGLRTEATGDVWTSLVETTSAGPGGAMWTLDMWLFRREPATGKLKRAHIILFGIIE